MYFAIQQAEDDPKIKGLVLDLNYFEGADLPALDFLVVLSVTLKMQGNQ